MNQTRSAHCAVRGFWISPASISWGSWISLDTPGWEEGEVFGTKLFFLHFVFSAFCASSTISFFVLLTELQERRSSSWSPWPMLEQVLSNAGAPLLRARFLEVQLLLLEHVFKSSSASIFWSAFSGVCVCVLSITPSSSTQRCCESNIAALKSQSQVVTSMERHWDIPGNFSQFLPPPKIAALVQVSRMWVWLELPLYCHAEPWLSWLCHHPNPSQFDTFTFFASFASFASCPSSSCTDASASSGGLTKSNSLVAKLVSLTQSPAVLLPLSIS